MAPMANTNPDKLEALQAHMTGGILILILMSLRLTGPPPHDLVIPPQARAGTALLDRLGRFSHAGFYIIVIAMALSGLTMGVQTGVIGLVAGGHPPIPPDFWAFPIRTVHYIISRVLMGLIALHLAGVVYITLSISARSPTTADVVWETAPSAARRCTSRHDPAGGGAACFRAGECTARRDEPGARA